MAPETVPRMNGERQEWLIQTDSLAAGNSQNPVVLHQGQFCSQKTLRDTSDCHSLWMLLAFSGDRQGTLLETLPRAGQPPQQRTLQPKMPRAQRLRNLNISSWVARKGA